MERDGLSRRTLLHLSAVAAGSAVLVGCSNQGGGSSSGGGGGAGAPAKTAKGSKTEPVPVPTNFKEAPALTKLVEAGELPQLRERLPERPVRRAAQLDQARQVRRRHQHGDR